MAQTMSVGSITETITSGSTTAMTIDASQTTAPITIGGGLTSGAISIGGGTSASGAINIGHVSVTGTSTINIGTGVTGSHPVNIGSSSSATTVNGTLTSTSLLTANGGATITGATSIGPYFKIPVALSNINYNLTPGAGGSTQTITVPAGGVYIYTFAGASLDCNRTIVTFVSAGINTCRLFNQYIHGGFSETLTATGNYTFTISGAYPSSITSFSVSYVKIG